MYIIQDREAGNFIDKFETLQDAEKALAQYEQTDKDEGTYTEDFYEIVEQKRWYAVLESKEDSDNGNGSFDYDEAVKMANDYGYKYIAVIDPKDDFCLDIIELENE